MTITYRPTAIAYFLLTLTAFSTLAHADYDESKEIREAKYVIENNSSTIDIAPDGTWTSVVWYSFKSQNEAGRIELSLRDIEFNESQSSIKVLEAYTLTDGIKTPTDLSHLEIRSTSESKVALEDIKKIIIPFNNVKSNSTVFYKYQEKLKKPLVPGTAFFGFSYGSKYPELQGEVIINSTKPISVTTLDGDHALQVKNESFTDKYRLTIRQIRPEYKFPSFSKMGFIPSDYFPMAFVSTASSWKEFRTELTRRYENEITQELPPAFQKISDQAKLIKGVTEQIDFVTTEVSKIVGYSGNWTTGEKMYFPKGHDLVVKEGKGDCKDYANSITAILRTLGLETAVALVSSSPPQVRGFRDIDFKSFAPGEIFNHAISYVHLKDGRTLWIDGTKLIPNSEGIWPDLAGEPALVLKEGVNELQRIPEIGLKPASIKLIRSVEIDGSNMPEWKGTLTAEGDSALTFIQADKLLGRSRLETALGPLLLGSVSDSTKIVIPNEPLRMRQSKIEIPFSAVAPDPTTEQRTGEKNLDIGRSLNIASFASLGGRLGVYMGPISTNETVTTYQNIAVEDEASVDCYILSPWADVDRHIKMDGKNTVLSETVFVKKSIISVAETKQEAFNIFVGEATKCMSNSHLVVVTPNSPPKSPETKEKNEALAALKHFHRLPIAAASEKAAEDYLLGGAEMEWNYVHLKSLRIFETAIAADPKNISARAFHAYATLNLGYRYSEIFGEVYAQTALDELNFILNEQPNFALARRFRARVFHIQKKFELEFQDASVAYRQDPQNSRCRIAMAVAQQDRGKADLSKQWIQAAMTVATKNKDDLIFAWNAAAHLATDRHDEAAKIEANQAMVKLKPNSPWSAHNLAITLGSSDQIDKAIEYERKALAIMDFGAARTALSDFLVKKAHSLMTPEMGRNYALDHNIENLLLEANKYNPSSELVAYYLSRLYLDRSVADHETDWIDRADTFLAQGLKDHPGSKSLLNLAAIDQRMKESLMVYFKKKNVNPSGRWPASFSPQVERKKNSP